MASAPPEPDGSSRVRALGLEHPDYPAGLRDLRDAPRVVYVRGRIPAWQRAVAVVGARAATPYGEGVARSLARDLAALGVAVVSGLARGIDAAAHLGALEAGGITVAVLPGGLDHVTPRQHAALAERIARSGALLSESAGGPPGARGVFVRRNRLIAALASATVVVEAGDQSGALSTAEFARRLSRPRLAVPGDVDRPGSRGCLALLRAGAQLCAGAADVIAAMPALPEGPEARLLSALESEPRAAELIAQRAELPLDRALAALVRLQWAGAAEACPGGRWRRSRPGVR
jgi:DNA processing protein